MLHKDHEFFPVSSQKLTLVVRYGIDMMEDVAVVSWVA